MSLKVQQLNSRTPPAGEEFGFRSCNCLLINGESRHLEALQEFAYTADLFITESRGKIGIAKEGYVVSGGGWMSDCSVVYLALSRPVVLQDTGWTHAIAPSRGLLAFRDARDCADGIRSIEADYETHSRAAQKLSRTIFSPEGTLKPLLEKIL